MNSRIERAFPYLLLAPAVIPLVYISGVVYPYVAPKTFFLQGLGILAFAAFAYLALSGRPFFYARLRAPSSWIPAALLAAAYIASLSGIDFYRSFWGILARGDGLLTLTAVTAFFYLILLSAPAEGAGAARSLFARFVKVVATTAAIVAAIALLQWATAAIFGREASFLPPVSGRIGSTFGNAAFLAGYLGMAIFIIILAFRDAVRAWRRFYKIAAILSALAVILAATRGTMLALLAALLAALAYAAVRRIEPGPAQEREERSRRAARYGIAALLLVGAAFFIFRAEFAQVPFEPVRRLASISLSDSTVSSRLFVWRHIGEEALQRPLAGYGAEHIAQIFDKVYDPGKIIEQWFDRSHNSFLDYFAQYGSIGLALYLALIGAFTVAALRLYRRAPPGLMNEGFLFLLLILAYAIQNFFVFDTPSSLWLLYALFALLLTKTSSASPVAFQRRLPLAVPALTASLAALLIIPAVALPLLANLFLAKGYRLHLIDVNRANAYFERGLALNTYADLEYGYQAYSMYTDHQAPRLSGAERIAAYEYALRTLTANFETYPYDARTATYLGHVLDTAPPEIAVDEAFDRQVLERAIALSPLRAQAWYMMANISLRKADSLPAGDRNREALYREAISILETYAQKEPALPVPRYILATLYYKLGDLGTAKKWADEAFPLYTESDTAAARPAVKYYIATEDWRRAVPFLADLAEDNPSDYDTLYDLAKVTYLAGDPASAARIVAELRKRNPAILETDQNFLAAINAYEQSKK